MTNDRISKTYDLEERTAKFGENIIKFCKKLPHNTITSPLINQLVKCGTSAGANYCEADDAESKLDFKHKIGICELDFQFYLQKVKIIGAWDLFRLIRSIRN